MKPLNLLWALILPFAFLPAAPPAQAGVSVGNASPELIAYRSDAGNFSVRYPAKLALNVLSAREFEISNAKLLSGEEPVSKVSFVILKEAVGSIAELKAYLQMRHAGRRFQELSLPGARGFASEERTPSHLTGLYYFLTSNGDLVEVSVSAYPQGDGLGWVAPIVASFTYDVSAPKLLGVKLDSPIWKAGEVHQVLFKATDENAGVSLSTSYVNLTRTGGADTWINSDLGAKRLENDWYAQEIKVSKFQASGKYCVDQVQSSDRAGNYSFLKRAQESQSVYEYTGDLAKAYPTNIPVVCVTLENSGLADSAPPMLLEVRAPEEVWDTMKDHRLSFRLSDDVSGVKVDEISCSYDADKFTCSDPRDEGGGWFSVKVKLNPYLAEQELKISGFSFKDNAGNGSDYTDDLEKGNYGYRRSLAPGKWPDAMDSGVPVFTQRVKNFGQVDTTAPQFLGIDAPVPLRSGHTGRVRFKARDEGSGLLLKTAESDLKVMDVILIPIADNKGKSLWLSTHEIVAEGNDWYHADFFISPFAAAGEYFVWTAQIRDRAYNEAQLDCGGPDTAVKPRPTEFCEGPGAKGIRPLRLTIIK